MADALSLGLSILAEEVMPAFDSLGPASIAYAQGSLTSGYTTEADLDVIVVWDTEVPLGRDGMLKRLHEAEEQAPFTYDSDSFSIDRFVRGGQEFNLAHHPRSWFDRAISHERDGARLARDRTALQVRSGFARGVVLLDRDGSATRAQTSAGRVPPSCSAEARRLAVNDWAYAEPELRKAVGRNDWLVFDHVLAESIEAQVVAVFALVGLAYPGLKWVRATMERQAVPAEAIARYGAIGDALDRAGRIDTADRLVRGIEAAALTA